MAKLSKTQQELLNKLHNTLNVLKKYNSYDDFFNNSDDEQQMLRTASGTGGTLENASQYRLKYPNRYNESKQTFDEAVNKNIILCSASSATLRVLERNGYIKIIEDGKEWIDHIQILKF